MTPGEALLRELAPLVDAWCDRRCVRALRHILPGWPLVSGLTDEWAELEKALKDVRSFAQKELTAGELAKIDELIPQVHRIVHRR